MRQERLREEPKSLRCFTSGMHWRMPCQAKVESQEQCEAKEEYSLDLWADNLPPRSNKCEM
eukprot:11039294-Karenia_brevis.AAC.1